MPGNYLKMIALSATVIGFIFLSVSLSGCQTDQYENHDNQDHSQPSDTASHEIEEEHVGHDHAGEQHECSEHGDHDADKEKQQLKDADHEEYGPEGHDHDAENEVVLSEEAMELARIETIKVDSKNLSVSIEVPGTIVPHPVKEALVGSLVEGRINKIYADIGDFVKAGSPLCVIESPEIGEAEAAYIIALAELEFLEGSVQRYQTLISEGIGSKAEFLEKKAQLTSASATVNAAKTSLYAMGFSESDLAEIKKQKQAEGQLTLRSPITGTVTIMEARLGMRVTPEDNLLHIIDNEHIRVRIDLSEKDASGIKAGMKVVVCHQNGKHCCHEGTIEIISSQVNPETRTIPAFIAYKNPDGCFVINGFVTATINKSEVSAIAVPAESILKDEHGDEVVYVMEKKGVFTAREVRTGETYRGWIRILEGLNPGEIVVSQGAFAIRSESQKGEYSQNCAH